MKKQIFLVLALLIGSLAVASAQTANDKYTWHAEMVTFDENARIITLKTRVYGEEALAEMKNFKAGDKIVFIWSGVTDSANGVYRVVRNTADAKGEERFVFPVEFVAFDATNQHVTFKTRVPADSVAQIRTLKPGEWITATSPHGRLAETQPILAAGPYGYSVSSNTTTKSN